MMDVSYACILNLIYLSHVQVYYEALTSNVHIQPSMLFSGRKPMLMPAKIILHDFYPPTNPTSVV